MQKRIHVLNVFVGVIFCLLFSACNLQTTTKVNDPQDLRDNTPLVYSANASGTATYETEKVKLDYSNLSEGYFMIQYIGDAQKVRLQLSAPTGTDFSYFLSNTGQYEVFPLSDGAGSYSLTILENISDDLYAIVDSFSFTADEVDAFKPFLYANQYVRFDSDSLCVSKAKELVSECYSDLDVISAIYSYITTTITYDLEKAQTVAIDYLPDTTETLQTQTGICFDYASLMTAMLRSQGIPTKLQVGYAGQVYHAWISTYVKDIGWIENTIEFDGTSWSLMDPTLRANNSNRAVKDYIGDGTQYLVKYTY